MAGKVVKFFFKSVLSSKGLTLCPLCDDAIIAKDGERACYHCTLDASWGMEV